MEKSASHTQLGENTERIEHVLAILKSLHDLQQENKKLEGRIQTLTTTKEKLEHAHAKLTLPFNAVPTASDCTVSGVAVHGRGRDTRSHSQAGGPTSPPQLADFTEFDPLKTQGGTGDEEHLSVNSATSHEVPQNGTSFTPPTGDMASPADEVRRLEFTLYQTQEGRSNPSH